jgi:hypothetical protein
MRHGTPEEPACRDSTLVHPSASTGLQKIWMRHPPHEKRTPTKFPKTLEHFGHLRTAMARTGRYEEKALHKAGVGGTAPV